LHAESAPVGASAFTMSHDFTSWSNQGGTRPHILALIDKARANNRKIVTAMTGGAHSWYITNGKFDMNKWKHGDPAVFGTGMDGYNTPAIKEAVAQAVADGVILGNVIMDEPEHSSWGGVMTKPMLDEMVRYVKAIFPTLPVGADFGPTRDHWDPTRRFTDMDFVTHQYNHWVTEGDVARFRDSSLAWDRRDGVRTVFSINVLNGGIQAARDGQWICDPNTTGGRGEYEPNCQVTPTQLRNWGILFGAAGAGLKMWKYDADMMRQTSYQTAAQAVANDMANRPAVSWRRP
jgi:hypothetical protein